MTPRVSVVIASYNCAAYLAEALDSVLAQTLPPHQVIVIDDGSKDHTPEVLAKYAGRVIAVRQENTGVSAARNRGLELADGDYVALLDADDVSAPERLAKQAAALAATPDAALCVCGIWRFTDAGRERSFPPDPLAETADPTVFWMRSPAHGPSVLFDRRKAGDVRFPVGVTSGEDMLFLGMLRSRGQCVAVPELLYGYRVRPGSASLTHSYVRSIEQRLNWIAAHGLEWLPGVTVAEMDRRVWGALAAELGRAYWMRERDGFLNLRAYLRERWPPYVPRAPELAWRWYPDWMWNAKERMSRLVGRGQ
jgi:glycosyltransferase involved in cell wall biosynthesis